MFTVFCKMTEPVHLHCMDKGQSINATSYIKICLEPLVAAIHDQRPKSDTKSVKLHHGNANRMLPKSSKNTYMPEWEYFAIRLIAQTLR